MSKLCFLPSHWNSPFRKTKHTRTHPPVDRLPGAPSLLEPLLDGLVWRSRSTVDGQRRVNYYVKHLVQAWFAERAVSRTANRPPRAAVEIVGVKRCRRAFKTSDDVSNRHELSESEKRILIRSFQLSSFCCPFFPLKGGDFSTLTTCGNEPVFERIRRLDPQVFGQDGFADLLRSADRAWIDLDPFFFGVL